MRNKRMLAMVCLPVLCLALPTAVAAHDWGCPELWDFGTVAAEAVSVYTLPDGGGDRLDNARLFGGARTDATIFITIYDCMADPVVGIPAYAIWVETRLGSLAFCAGGNEADTDTDANGQTFFGGPLRAGGSSRIYEDDRIRAYYNGQAFLGPGLDIRFNSADISGDLAVNLSDISLFAHDYYGAYDYRSDFYWDGVLNLSDISLLSQGHGAACP